MKSHKINIIPTSILIFILLANYGIEIDRLKKEVKELKEAEYLRGVERKQTEAPGDVCVENCVQYSNGPLYPENLYRSPSPEIPDE